ncbi:putative transmembrane protein [Mycobacterium europaeum]|uniref:Putative transmembrane protein n=2 Tax=Mycobacterium europaeum TaxID=761804 RepID=A0A0U1D3X5_9MYCO|nr:putative transmembrane protein [Mycobacterium europaeum]
MPVDLPPGKFTAFLIGPWWSGPPTALRAAAQYWNQACEQQQVYAQDLRGQRTAIVAHNQGRTADDLATRYYEGEQLHLNLAEKYRDKAAALNNCADQVDTLRSRLRDLAAEGNQQIDRILASKEPDLAKLAEIQAVQVSCNAKAEAASDMTVSNMTVQTQDLLRKQGISGNAEAWSRQNGIGEPSVPRPQPISEDDLKAPPHGSASRDLGWSGNHGGGNQPASGRTPAPPNGAGIGRDGGNHGLPQAPGGRATGSPVSSVQTPTAQGPIGGSPAVSGMAPIQGAPMPTGSSMGQSTPNLAQSFAGGMASGQPAGAGPQSLSTNAMNAMEAGAPPATQAEAPPPLATPSVPAGAAFIPTHAPVDAVPPPADAPAQASGGTASVPPAVLTGGSWSAPAAPVGGAPPGPLPAYGSDLRPPPVVAPPSMPAAPAAPISGAPVAPSPASSPSAGGPVVSPVERAAQGAAAGQAGTGSSTMVGASAASAAAGGAAGAASNKAAEQQRLQRIVDSVARQEPRLSWAAGLRDDGITTLLVTDLAGGWIPPHVRLPAHVTLLEPSARRRDANVLDLLGSIVVEAAHHANTYVGEPGNDEPLLTGDRLARSATPHVDELGPTLVEAVRRRDGLPRIAQAVAAPAARKTGVLENEDQLLRECIADIQNSVLTTYPHHDQAVVGDWMLLAAIEALIDEHQYLANYHLAWFDVINERSNS